MEKILKRMAKIQSRADTTQEDGQIVEGYAATFNQETVMYKSDYSGWEYREVIMPGAFEGCDMSDVILNYNHGQQAMILARTKNGTLSLATDENGLKVRADIIKNNLGSDVYELVKRGDLDKMSFAFVIREESDIEDRENKIYTRQIRKLKKLYDVSIVDFPAYDSTSVSARDGEKVIKEILEKEKRMLLARLI